MSTSLVAGVDTSTQSCKVVVCEADTGRVVREGRGTHPDATAVDPARWWEAFEAAADWVRKDPSYEPRALKATVAALEARRRGDLRA